MLRSTSDPDAVPHYNRRAIQGVPPLTGDGLQFDAPLDHPDPGPLLDRPTPLPSGGRTFVVAFAVISALLVGLIAGFAGGYFVAQRTDPIPAPRSAAQAVPPESTYTEAPVNDQELPTDPVRPTSVIATNQPGSLQIASRPAGAQVFVDDVHVGVTPMLLADVTAGAHRVRIELPGFRRWATTVNVETGERARVGASLER